MPVLGEESFPQAEPCRAVGWWPGGSCLCHCARWDWLPAAGTGSLLLGLPQRALSWVGPADSEVRVWTVLMTDLPEGEES